MKKILYIILGAGLGLSGMTYGATILYPTGGGTGTSTIPSYGQMLVGNAGGTYTLTATSSLGISATGSSSAFSTTSAAYWLTTNLNPLTVGYLVSTTTATSTFSGALSVLNFANTSMTTGSIPFFGAGGYMNQNNANLFWDNTNARLGLGTTSPYAKLSITGTSATTPTAAFYGFNNQTANLFLVATTTGAATSTAFVIDSNGKVGVGTSTPYTELSVAGGGAFDYLNVNRATATSTFAGGVNITGNGLQISSTGKLYQNSNLLSMSDLTGYNLTYGYQAGAALAPSLATYNTAIGYQALNIATSSDGNVAIGYLALANTKDEVADANTAVGFQALTNNTTGQYNSAFGYNVLVNNTRGVQNSAQGYQALFYNTTGGYNTAQGHTSMYKNTTGTFNTAQGLDSLSQNLTGTNNVAQGFASLRSNITGGNNTAQGASSLYFNASATNTTAIGYNAAAGTAAYSNQGGVYLGYQAGYNASTGSNYNTLLGYQAGYNITTGSYNIIIGQNVDATSTTASGQLNIGNVLFGTGMYRATAVSGAETAGNIGVGTTSPWARLSVAGASSGTIPLFAISTSTASATSTAFIIDSNGKVGVGTSTPYTQLSVAGGGAFDYLNVNRATATSTFAGGLTVAGTSGLTVLQNGKVGVGTTTPAVSLDVNGYAKLLLVATSTACSAQTQGSFFYNQANDSAWVCGSGSVWKQLGVGTVTGGSGTVTSVDMSVPTGLTIAGNPITESGTLALSLTAGYTVPLTSSLWATTSSAYWWQGVNNPITAGYMISTSTATSTWAGGHRITGGLTTTQAVEAPQLMATSTTATSTFAGGLNITGGGLSIGTISGFLKATAGAVTTGLVDLASNITGVLGIGNGGTNATTFSDNALVQFDGTRLVSVSSPTVGSIISTSTATSTFAGGLLGSFASFWNGLEVSNITATSTATSTFAGGIQTAGLSSSNGLTITGGSSILGTVSSGVWQGTAIGDAYLTKSGDWTGTLDGYNATDLLGGGFSTTSADYWHIGKVSTLTVGSLISTSTATSTFAGGIRVTGGLTTTQAVEAPQLMATSTTATSTFAGGVKLSKAATGLEFNDGTIQNTAYQYPSFTYATSTAWTGTTTIPLGVAFVPEKWSQVMCYTDVGTVFVQIGDGTNFMTNLQASTTVGTVTLLTNNVFTAGEKRYVNIGTPATSPTKISCTIRKLVNQ